jgi:hypothetical protein
MKHTTILRIAFFLSIPVAFVIAPCAQNAKPPATPPSPPQSSSQSSTNLPPIQLDANAVLHHLNEVISWYRLSTTGIRDVGLPSDAIYQDNAKTLGAQVVQLAFQSARAASPLVAGQKNASEGQETAGNTQQQKLEQLRAKTTSQIDQLQSQIDGLNTRIRKTPASKRTSLVAQRDGLQGQLDLQKSLLDAVQKMAAFVDSNGEGSGGLEGDINRLAQTIPEVFSRPNTEKTAGTQDKIEAAKSPSKPSMANSGGLIGDAMILYDYMSAIHQIQSVIKETNYTHDVAEQLRNPLRDAFRAAIRQSQELANQNAADAQQLQAQKQQLQNINRTLMRDSSSSPAGFCR